MTIIYQEIYKIFDLDNGIIKYIQEINNLGYKTIMSCSGMRKDHYHTDNYPFICFTLKELNKRSLNKFFSFITDCLYNSNWYVELYPLYIIGYLPLGLNDSDIENRFQKLLKNLRMQEFFKKSY